MERDQLETRLQSVEDKLARLETLMVKLSDKLDGQPAVASVPEANAMREWVTDYVSMRLQQLVPHTCEHIPQDENEQGPFLEGTDIPCTDEVVHRVGRIPIPFVREMVVQRVAQKAREDQIHRVDIAYFEKSATF
ncbi:MAG: hypothetical protein ETSY1_38005 [Candidatus Entotheonella factor]|uniref:Uncharacterized protein n=1 Tax=Entotheonella factor TaxID=1429438 RepID=W4L6Q4_ENTF1|nr:hypothetical protein [Candidatus Entotheonella palauensis]ETW93722.1 MAG: hypothetical protein ETSY1_38005 [Candidatus Entotheonella factor]